jgi:hypothetical protein
LATGIGFPHSYQSILTLYELTVVEVAGSELKLFPWARILLEKLAITQLVKGFLVFYGIKGF